MDQSAKMIPENNQAPAKKKKNGWVMGFLMHAVDKVFYQVYDGEPVAATTKVRRLNSRENILEEEVLFCKNNICVHDVSNSIGYENCNEKHLPGYMNMKKIYRSDNEISDLMLSWVPNTLLTVANTEEAEILSSPDVSISDFDNSNATLEDAFIPESTDLTPLRLNESLNVQDFETPLGDMFSINLVDVKTIKLFYTNPGKDSGQFVICSKESEYKVFHFHNGGLIKLTEIFNLWNGCYGDVDLDTDQDGQQVYYIVGNIKESKEVEKESHPDEGRYKPMNMNHWLSTINQLGQIEDAHNFRKHVFFGGLSQEVRPDAWKYLLYYYPMQSTVKDRELMKEQKQKWYQTIQEKRLSLSGEEYESFWKNIQFTVDKDVVRTDRSHPYYAGQQNPNIDKMRNILLNYAHYNPDMGYTQGMSDLVAPLIATLHDESESFWCFVGLMEFSMFATTPTDKSMDKSLGFLRELLRIMLPEFYMHCLCNDFDLNLLFTHRWLVLCFKREFIFHEVLKIWETCWARYQTDYFHIFICVAIVSLYGKVCLEKKMDAVEILQYFTDMAMKFDGSATLIEGRSLLYKFRQLSRVPCTLRGLLSGKGVWDGGISPEVECVSHNKKCCQEFAKSGSSTTSPDNDVDKERPSTSSHVHQGKDEIYQNNILQTVSDSDIQKEDQSSVFDAVEVISTSFDVVDDQNDVDCDTIEEQFDPFNLIPKDKEVTSIPDCCDNSRTERIILIDDGAALSDTESENTCSISVNGNDVTCSKEDVIDTVCKDSVEVYEVDECDNVIKSVEELTLIDDIQPDNDFLDANIY